MITPIVHPIDGRPGLVPLDGGGRKIVWHTTEGGNNDAGLMQRCRDRDLATFRKLTDGTLAYYRQSGFVVHYTVCAQLREVYQHLPTDVGGYALEDTAGGVRTNRAGERVIQFEQIGHAVQIDDEMSDEDWRWMGDWLQQIAAETGVPYHFITPWNPYPSSYGGAAPQRMTGPQFQAFAGICGHQHVPENAHGDPGAIRLDLLAEPLPPPTPNPPPVSEEDDEMPLLMVDDQGNYFRVGDTVRNVGGAELAALKAKLGEAIACAGDEAWNLRHQAGLPT